MTTTVCLFANSLHYPEGGGHRWVYLNWALGLRALGCQVIWLEGIDATRAAPPLQRCVAALKRHLTPYGLGDSIALFSWTGKQLLQDEPEGCVDLETAVEADLLLNFRYDAPADLVARFRRSALVDIDPGLLQIWMSRGEIRVAQHDSYFTTGETVGEPWARSPDAGLRWQHTRPCVALHWWPTRPAAPDACFTTVSHWHGSEWTEDAHGMFLNDKRSGFQPFLDLPACTTQPLELALLLSEKEEDERAALLRRGWRVRDAHSVASTPWDYQRYIQDSLGEFSCAKPSCIRLQNAWISDRTLCYLASGKPGVVQHTGPSQCLPDSAGLFRFWDVEGAARSLERVAADYERQCALARALVEEHFDAQRVVKRLLERALA